MTWLPRLGTRWLLLAMLVFAPAPAHAGGLTFIDSPATFFQQDLQGLLSVAVSSDTANNFVYAAARTAGQGSVSVWKRESTGELTFVAAKFENDLPPPRYGIDNAYFVAVAPAVLPGTGTHVYVAGEHSDSVGVFHSDATTGLLTYVEQQKNGVGSVGRLGAPRAVALSPDGKHVYAVSTQYDAVVVFSRDQETGELTWVEEMPPLPLSNKIVGLEQPEAVVLSPDGLFVYVAGSLRGGSLAGTIVVFGRNPTDGKLTLKQTVQNGDEAGAIQRLQNPRSLVVSPELTPIAGKHLYVGSEGGNALLAFDRDETLGTLSLIEIYHSGAKGLVTSYGVAMDPAGNYVYIAGQETNALSVFRRDATTGKLVILETHINPNKLPDDLSLLHGLNEPRGVVVTADGKNVYVAARPKGSIVAFKNDECGNGNRGVDEQCDDHCDKGVDKVCEPIDDGDGCSKTCELELCPAAPIPGPCRTPTVPDQASLKISNDASKADSKDALQWQWKAGPATAITEYGNPVTTDDYVLCVYDATGTLLMSPAAPWGGACKKGKPCWKLSTTGTNFSYSDGLLTPSGLSSVKLKASPADPKAQVSFKGKGVFLKPPALPLAVPLPLKVQVISTTPGNGCWQAIHTTPVKNDDKHYQAKGK